MRAVNGQSQGQARVVSENERRGAAVHPKCVANCPPSAALLCRLLRVFTSDAFLNHPFDALIARSLESNRPGSTAGYTPLANFTQIDVEQRLTLEMQSIPGSISYRTIGTVADPTIEFQMLIPGQ